MRPTNFLALFALLVAPALGGCASEAAESEADTAAYTVASGHEFVVRASPNEVVLHRTVNGRAFPVAGDAMVGKAILIHPIEGKAEGGVYARVLSAHHDAMNLVLATEPLTLEEMTALSEDDVVRIYLDPSLSTARPETEALRPASDPFGLEVGGVRPRSWGGLLNGEFTPMGEIEIAPDVKLENNLTVTHDGGHLSLVPQVMTSYSRAQGLELGLRSRFAWDSSLSFKGDTNVRAKIFRTPRVGPPGVWVTVPIGPFPVPVRLRLVAFLECESMGKVQFDGTLAIHVAANIGGSIRLVPSAAPLSTWVTQGPWPFEIGGAASANLTGDIRFGAGSGIECSLPRVELETLIAGVDGPYLAIASEARRALSEQLSAENSMNITLKVGMRGKLFGREANSELDLLSWTPN